MNRLATLSVLVIGIAFGFFGARLRPVSAHEAQTPTVIAASVSDATALPLNPPRAETMAKKCGFDSDCPYGKCSGGSCGSCGFDSDCKGWGRCKSGACGACNFDSDCKDFGGCSNGRCNKSPY